MKQTIKLLILVIKDNLRSVKSILESKIILFWIEKN